MPYRIIIADDEPKLIRLIKELVDFKELGIEIAAECRDGEEAYLKILEYRPDIVLSDIKMPVYDGICLIEKVRKHGLNTRFILISGYRHFEYARSAVRLNVVDYLLKPIDAIQLRETLINACRKVNQIRNLDADSEELRKIKTERKKSRMEGFWNYIAQSESKGEENSITEEICNRDYDTSFQPGCYQVLCIYCNINGLLGQQDSILIEKMNHTIDKTIGEVGRVYCHAASCQSYILVVNFDKEQDRLMREAVTAMYYNVRDLREMYGNFELIVGCSRIKSSINELKTAYSEAYYAEWGRMVLAGSFLIDYDQIAGLKRFKPEAILNDEECNKLRECIKYLREEELGEIFRILNSKALENKNSYPGDMCAVFDRLKTAIMDGCDNPDTAKKMKEECFYAYMESKCFQKLFQKIFLCIERHISGEKRKVREKLGKPISEAISYMKKNYKRDISLEEAAQAGNLSPSYFSKLFKTEMHCGFLEYLTQMRLNESEKLLAESSLSIKEIALAVGYPDEKYYSRLFKKMTGIKPSEFRKIYN